MGKAAGRVVALAAAALLLTAGSLAVAPAASTSAASAQVATTAPDGAALYYRTCAACHGNAGQGLPGTGESAGPPLVGLPVAYVDQVLRTGRMPIALDEVGVREEQLSDEQRRALVAWATGALGLTGGVPRVGPGEAGPGQALYARYCAACHGAAAAGGAVGGGVRAPSLVGVDPVAVAEAVRVGPFSMPAFDEGVLSEREVDDIAAFLDHLEQTPATPIGLVEVNQVVAALFVGLLVLLGTGAAVLVGRLGAPARRQDDAVSEPAG